MMPRNYYEESKEDEVDRKIAQLEGDVEKLQSICRILARAITTKSPHVADAFELLPREKY